MPNVVPIGDADDPRLLDYRELKERRLAEDSGKLVAESELVVKKLLESGLRVVSVLVAPPRLAALEPALRAAEGDYPVYLASQEILDRVVGFHVHRGCLAVALRPAAPRLPDELETLVVLEDLVDVDNLGSLVRNAAALGGEALLLSPRCADPYYRKAVRTSTGHVFAMPIVRARSWPGELAALKPRFQLLALTLSERARPLHELALSPRVALVLGTEGRGLSPEAVAACDVEVTIPMAPRADSLNVATAGALALYQLRLARR